MTAPTEERVRPEPGRHFERPTGGPSRRWMTVFSGLLAVAVLAAGALTYVGVRTVRESRAGRSVSTVTDPALPGFEAFLEPTPTLVVLHQTAGRLLSIAVLALSSSDAGGSVLLVPVSTRTSSDQGALTLGAVAAFQGSPGAVVPGLQAMLGIGIEEVVVADDARWADLVAPVEPLTFDNPDTVGPFAAGPLSLAAAQVGPYLAAEAEGESAAEHLFRQQLLFEAWVDAVAASSRPGPRPRRGRHGHREVRAGPGGRAPRGRHPAGRRRPRSTAVAPGWTWSRTMSPSSSPPWCRSPPRGDRAVACGCACSTAPVTRTTCCGPAPVVVPARSEIVVVGNADRFDYETTEIRYHDPTKKAAAEALQAALGAGRVVDDVRQTDAFDVTIVLGTDV